VLGTKGGPQLQKKESRFAGAHSASRRSRWVEVASESCRLQGRCGESRRFGDEEAQAEVSTVADSDGTTDHVWKFNAKSIA